MPSSMSVWRFLICPRYDPKGAGSSIRKYVIFSSRIQWRSTDCKMSITSDMSDQISSFWQHKWTEPFLCWAHCHKYMAHSSRWLFTSLRSVTTFKYFFTPEKKCLHMSPLPSSVSCLDESSPFHTFQSICSRNQSSHLSNIALWYSPFCGRNRLNSTN